MVYCGPDLTLIPGVKYIRSGLRTGTASQVTEVSRNVNQGRDQVDLSDSVSGSVARGI